MFESGLRPSLTLTCSSEARLEDVSLPPGDSEGGPGGQTELRGPGRSAHAHTGLEEGGGQDAHWGAGGGERRHPPGESQQAPPGNLPVCRPGRLRPQACHKRRGGFCRM